MGKFFQEKCFCEMIFLLRDITGCGAIWGVHREKNVQQEPFKNVWMRITAPTRSVTVSGTGKVFVTITVWHFLLSKVFSAVLF